MAKCQGRTKSGTQCRRQASEGSEYCSSHQPAEDAEGAEAQDQTEDQVKDQTEDQVKDQAEDQAEDQTEDLMLIALGLVATGVMFLVLKTVGRWFPKL